MPHDLTDGKSINIGGIRQQPIILADVATWVKISMYLINSPSSIYDVVRCHSISSSIKLMFYELENCEDISNQLRWSLCRGHQL